jgi:hypothetical protein
MSELNELFYFPSVKVNARVSELVIEGCDIKIDNYTYVRLSRRPKNRRVLRRLQSYNDRITIYS